MKQTGKIELEGNKNENELTSEREKGDCEGKKGRNGNF